MYKPNLPRFYEVLGDIEEFDFKVDKSKPIHYRDWYNVEPHGRRIYFKFRIYGIAKQGHVLVFEIRFDGGPFYLQEGQRRLAGLVQDYAIPLGATPGRIATLSKELDKED